ncbi:PAS domain S-box protein [Conexibacter sp. W3-3-2]|nr:PAS domain S-box protein [Conexibacter sp. W3-3-2]MTD46000.1 PAS domain S-box protein [Conexibacter sp. W3-3-2]
MTEALSPFGDRAVRAALAAMPGVSVVVVDREMRIVSVEGGALIRHGYIPERVVGRRAPDVLPAPAWETLGPLYTRALTGETVTVELPSHDGTAVYESTFAPLREAGELVGATISSRDVTAARGALHRAEASGRRLRALLDTSPDGHCRHDAQGRVLWASRAMSTLLGCAPAELDGSRVPSALHPEDREPLTRAFERVRRTREPQTVEVRCCHPDGSWRWLEVAVRGLFADTGDALEIHTTWRDTTSRYDADQLRAQWRHAFDRTTVGVAVIDPITHRMERVNDAFAWMHGGVPSDFEGRHLGDTFAPHERGRIRDISQRAHAVGYVRYEADHVRLDGTAFPTETEVIAARDAEGNLVYRLGYFRDVTEERRAQQELVRREADFRMLAETSTDVVLRIAPDGSLRYVSPAATAVLGASPEHVDAGFLHRSTLPEDRCQNAELRAAVVRDGRSRTSESRFTRPDGEQVWLETTIRALHDDTGEVIELHASVRDITRRRRGEDAARLWQLSWEVAPRGLAILDEESGLVEAVNPVFAAQHGGRPEDLVGRSLRDLLPASELQRAGSIASAMEVEGRVTTEVDHLRLDGSRFPARVELVAIRDHDGRVVRRISVCTDLTEERARAEAERRATSRFERAFSEAPAGMALLRDGRFERVNEALASLLEVPADELVGERMARFADAFASADPLEARDGEQRLITARGRIVQVRVRSSVLREGAAGDALLIHVIDLTAEVEVRAARERASAQFEAAFGAAPIGLALVGLDGHWLRVNPALCRLFGRSEEDLLASDFQTLTHPDDLDADLELLEQTLAGERAGYEMSKRYLRSDGTVVDARLSVSLLRDREGDPTALRLADRGRLRSRRGSARGGDRERATQRGPRPQPGRHLASRRTGAVGAGQPGGCLPARGRPGGSRRTGAPRDGARGATTRARLGHRVCPADRGPTQSR